MSAVVVGGGLAGAAAALEIAAAGLAVTRVRKGPGATAFCWGSLDVAGASPLRGGLPWRDPLRGEPLTPAERLAFLLRTRTAHPYGLLFPGRGEEAASRAMSEVKSAAAWLDERLRPSGLGVEGGLEESRLLVNVRGEVRVGDLVLSDCADGDPRSAATVVLVDLPGLEGWDARPAARTLAAELAALGVTAPAIRVERPALPARLRERLPSPARLSAALDLAEGRAAFAEALAPLGGEDRLLLLPPVLGLVDSAGTLEALRAATRARVAELLGSPPWSPAGLRLDRALGAALDRAGVETLEATVTAVERLDGRAHGVRLLDAPGAEERLLPAAAVVLASGRFSGGGLSERDGRVRESLLDLPLHDERGRRVDGDPALRAVHPDPEAPQPLFSAGVAADAHLRPLAADGRPALVNLLAAGELLGGFDPALIHSGLGFALLSGRRAGAEAVALLGSDAEEGA